MYKKSRFEALGDRIKAFEMAEAGRSLLPGVPVMVRLDGRSFHTFTKGMPRPYFEPMSKAMIETARYLVEMTNASFAYTQSDEITLGYFSENKYEVPVMFDGRFQKLTSILASMASVKFNCEVMQRMPDKAHMMPLFDARVFNLPTLEDMADAVLFRTMDCAKNSITMAASAYYSHKELQGKNSADKHEMLYAKGVNWANYPEFFKNGTFLRRESVFKTLTEEELSRIPEAHRPKGPIERTEVLEVDMPPFIRISNPVRVLFYKEIPILTSDSTSE